MCVYVVAVLVFDVFFAFLFCFVIFLIGFVVLVVGRWLVCLFVFVCFHGR